VPVHAPGDPAAALERRVADLDAEAPRVPVRDQAVDAAVARVDRLIPNWDARRR